MSFIYLLYLIFKNLMFMSLTFKLEYDLYLKVKLVDKNNHTYIDFNNILQCSNFPVYKISSNINLNS